MKTQVLPLIILVLVLSGCFREAPAVAQQSQAISTNNGLQNIVVTDVVNNAPRTNDTIFVIQDLANHKVCYVVTNKDSYSSAISCVDSLPPVPTPVEPSAAQ